MKNRYIEISKSRLSQFEEQIPWGEINRVIEFGSSYGDTLESIGIKNNIKKLIGFDLQKPQSSKINLMFTSKKARQLFCFVIFCEVKNTEIV